MDDISRLIIPKKLTETMYNTVILTIDNGIEFGFNIFYPGGTHTREIIMYPGQICAGTNCDVEIKMQFPFLTNTFGSFHTHPNMKRIKDCIDRKEITDDQIILAINRNQSRASITDLLTSIEDLFLRGDTTDSAVLISSDIDMEDNVSISIPKRSIPTENYKKALRTLEMHPEPEYTMICDVMIAPNEKEIYNYIFDLFYHFKFSIPSDKDIIIERNNETGEYKII